MKYTTTAQPVVKETGITDLPWPKTWQGAYIFVIGSFIFWLTFLIALTEFFV